MQHVFKSPIELLFGRGTMDTLLEVEPKCYFLGAHRWQPWRPCSARSNCAAPYHLDALPSKGEPKRSTVQHGACARSVTNATTFNTAPRFVATGHHAPLAEKENTPPPSGAKPTYGSQIRLATSFRSWNLLLQTIRYGPGYI